MGRVLDTLPPDTFVFPKMAQPFVHQPSYNVIVSTVQGPRRPL